MKARDFLGEIDIPEGALWGAHVERARRNFPVTCRAVDPGLVRAYAFVKKACARANREGGWLDARIADAIEVACDEIARGERADQFPVDALQGGAGTSTNMNLNEVIATLASEKLGNGRGHGGAGDRVAVDPLDHVNLHQSTNDTYPTALRVALLYAFRELASRAEGLQSAFQAKEREFAAIVTVGRTELRTAVPLTLGSEFGAYAEAFARDRWRAFKCEERLRVVNLGGVAVGTGLGAPRDYIFRATDRLREITGLPLARAENLVDATANADAIVEASGIAKAFACDLVKAARDLRFLSHTGEIVLEPVQAGSSAMPGKVNPVLLEAAMQAGMRAQAEDSLVAAAASAGSLQINEFLPLIADASLGALRALAGGAACLERCVRSLRADPARCRELVDADPMIVSAFVPLLGYDGAGDLLREWESSPADGRPTLRAFLEEKLGANEVARVLAPESLMSLGFRGEPGDKR